MIVKHPYLVTHFFTYNMIPNCFKVRVCFLFKGVYSVYLSAMDITISRLEPFLAEIEGVHLLSFVV